MSTHLIQNIKDIDISDSESENESEREDNTRNVKTSKEFDNTVREYLKLNLEIEELQGIMKEKKKKRKPHEENILKYLKAVGEKVVEVTNKKLDEKSKKTILTKFRLRKNKSETKKKIDSTIIKESIMEKVKDAKMVAEILKLMESKRVTVTNVNLKVTRDREKK